MSNLTNIGFDIRSKEALMSLAEMATNVGRAMPCDLGTYFLYEEVSGAQLYCQVNDRRQLIGVNPHFTGESRRHVCLTSTVERKDSPLDGAYHGWANPPKLDDPQGGEYPFVFDVPDFRLMGEIVFPKSYQIQLTAFASLDFHIFDDEAAFDASGVFGEVKLASSSFIPSGLFTKSPAPPAQATLSGIIKACSEKVNQFSNTAFWWFLVDTLGGEIDVVADKLLIKRSPKVGDILFGAFWLSGRLISPMSKPNDYHP